jgi:very-short-patch-repair endonuclease
VDAVVAAKIGFATHQNAIPVVRDLNVTAPDDLGARNLILSLSADPPFVQPKTWRIDAMAPRDELAVADRDVALNATLLHDLTESMTGTLILTLSDDAGSTLVERSHPVELLAHNQWGGLGTMAELLPAFVMPNDPAIDRVLKAASDVLRSAGKPDALDGYQSGERGRVWELASAIWSAVAGMRLSYALPPASFERTGQKVRTPSQILEGRVATCLDTALLFAAALEQASLNPILVLTEGHAFVGVWLQPVEFGALVTDEAAALRRRFDLDDLVVFETTLATHNPPASFSQAMAAARRQIAEDSDTRFEMAIDVRRARMQKIRPLGVVGSGGSTSADQAVTVSEGLEAAPALPAFDVEVSEEAPTAGGRILQWQRKLLNLTTSNNLLNLRDGKSVVKLLCPDPGALEDILADGRKVRVVPMPDLDVGGRDEKLYEQQTQTSLRLEVAEQAMKRGEALSLLSKDKLDAAMVELYRKARTDMEEGGANTLYLALGFLKWKKSPTEEKVYRAPLILLPVRLERKSALSGVTMIAHEDEPRFNLTLLELLRQDFELTIPGLDGDLPKDSSGIDVAGIWRKVREAVRDIAGFEVVPEVVIGTFSFAKYLMWKDLVDRADRLKESPLVRHLIDRDGSVDVDPGGFPRADELDAKVDPSSLFIPLPADSSQLVAVMASAEGRNFVLVGPPGTGKSQTIGNIIAHNLALGRRVLFVAEKRAALDVVQRRLANKGLAPFCLELHSAKATKSAVLKQLDSAWTARDALTAEEWEREALDTRRLRDELNGVVALLHRREANGWTIHRAIGVTVRDATDSTPKFVFASSARHSEEDMVGFRDVARRLGIARKAVTDLPADLDGVARTEWSNGWQEDITAAAGEVPGAIDAVEGACARVETATKLPIPGEDRAQLGALLKFAEICLAMHGHDLRFAFAPDMMDRVIAVRDALALIGRYKAEEAALSAPYAPEAARRVDIEGMQTAWTVASGRFWFLATLAQRKIARALALAGGASGPVEPEADLSRLSAMRDLLMQIDGLAARASGIPGWAGLATDGSTIELAIERAERLRSAVAAEADGPETLVSLRRAVSTLVVDANEMLAGDGPVAGAVERLRRALERLDKACGRFDDLAGAQAGASFAALRMRARVVVTHARRLHDWTSWRRVRDEGLQAGIAPLVEGLERGSVAPEASVATFETAYARWFAFVRIDDEPLLTHFMAGEQDDRIARFRELDDRMAELSTRYIRAKLCGLIPDKNDVGKKDGYGTLKHQLQLQRPSMPIRKLASEMGDAFTRLAPCMLMSPLSIAQYLPADQALFDLVIFDEASQITPWDAIGAMARGKQVVIAGDPKQMPPSNDFQRGSGTATVDDDTLPDLPSILDECLGAGVPSHRLDWHYRSKHESLITFSNARYYGNELVTFPPPETRPSAVSWHRVPGVYTSGIKTNPIEAQAIVDEVVRRLRDPAFVDEKGAPLSLGIITMNAEQMRLVEDLLDKARRSYPAIELHFDAETRLEPVCVRNLETVQGDERDVILLGVNFGPTDPGGKTMSMYFGKLNNAGGERRLNVAATRARREMKVFTSFDPGMIDLTRTAAEGVRDLKAFIEFADRGPRALAEANKGSLGDADSPFEEAVTAELRRRGWTAVPQVGVSKFRIDLGIVHPDRPGDYLVGVECDGASYHSAATARDRDKVRAAILEGLGWTLVRIWSTDWWIDKQRAADRLHAKIEEHLAADRARVAERELAEASASHEHGMAAEKAPETDIIATPIGETGEPVSLPLVVDPSTPILIVEQVDQRREPVYARLAEPVMAQVSLEFDGGYRTTVFTEFRSDIDPQRFYEPGYNETLRRLIDHVLRFEAPIAEDLLVQRIARAHGFQRAGRIIHDRVMQIAIDGHFVEQEVGGGRFVWLSLKDPDGWDRARAPASMDDIRLIEDIALAEIRAARRGRDVVEVARLFGVRRLSASARERIEAA